MISDLIQKQLVVAVIFDCLKLNVPYSTLRLFTFATYGNKILQPMVALAMLYYTWLQVELKRTSVEARAKQYFPWIVFALLLAELFLAIWYVNVQCTRILQNEQSKW